MGPGAMVFSKCTVFASLGERAIVGANSLVSKPVPPYCFAAGSPARVIEYYGRPENRPEGLEVG
jgi:acetyltransferase-like isoleucine patch superfamily enzyme